MANEKAIIWAWTAYWGDRPENILSPGTLTKLGQEHGTPHVKRTTYNGLYRFYEAEFEDGATVNMYMVGIIEIAIIMTIIAAIIWKLIRG